MDIKYEKIIDLTHPIHSGVPHWDGDSCFKLETTWDYKDSKEPNLFRVQKIDLKLSTGTHIDSPAHCIPGGKTIDQMDLNELITDCAVINVSDIADENYVAGPEVIQEFENKHGKLQPGTFVILYTGWDKYWDDKDKFRNNLNFPSASENFAKLLLERNVSGLGIDSLSPDAHEDFPVHRAFLGAGKYLVENVANAGQLPPTGAKISIIMPMNIKDATEAPIRLVGFV